LVTSNGAVLDYTGQHGNTYPLLLALVASVALPPFLVETRAAATVFNGLLTAIIIAGVRGIAHDRTMLRVVLPTGFVALVLMWVAMAIKSRIIGGASFLAGGITMVLLIAVLIRGVIESPRVTLSSVSGGVCGYLLTGFAWAYVFALLESIWPGSFLREGTALAKGERGLQELVYFAFITLSTLGFGDILPASPPAEGFAVLAAITGQLYLAILLAALVGRFVARGDRPG
jgi:hypothetical protein